MRKTPKPVDPQSVFCEVCAKRNPQRDEPRADSVERDELPPS